MSTHRKNDITLPPLQKEIFLHLAKNGPQTINETAIKINHHYKPSWMAFNSLEQKGIVRKGETKEYRGNRYPLYWLTEEGVIMALIEAPSKELLTNTKQVYPKNQILQYGVEMGQYANPEIFRVFLNAIKSKGKLEPVDLATIIFTQMEIDTSFEKFLEALETMKKYPKEYKDFKEHFSRMQKHLEKMAKII